MADSKISQLTDYTTPLNADLIPVVDTANTTTKKTTWTNIKATLKTYFDTLYVSVSSLVITTGKTITFLKSISFTSADDTGTYTLPTGTKTLLATDGSAANLTSFPTFNQDTTGKSAKTDGLNSATTVVNVSSATAPSATQVLTATDSTHATWQTPTTDAPQTITQAFPNAASAISNGYSDVLAIGTTGGTALALTIANQPPQQTYASTHISGGDTINSFVVLGSYVYILVTETSTTPDTKAVYRCPINDIASAGTIMTYSGAIGLVNANTDIKMTSDGTYIYLSFQAGNSANSYVLSKFSVSGTVLTYVADVTCGSAAISDFVVLATGNIYAHSAVDTNDLLKFDSSGTLTTTYDEVLAVAAVLHNFNGTIYLGAATTLSRTYLS